jgi:Fe-S-cluster containining protein
MTVFTQLLQPAMIKGRRCCMITASQHPNMRKNTNPSQIRFHSEVDKVFFTDGYNLAVSFLRDGINIENLVAMSGAVYESMDQLMEAFIQRCLKEKKTVECKKGCYLCCCQAVLLLPHEILFLCRFMQENMDKKERTVILNKAKEKDNETSIMKAQEFLHHKSPCPLLENGSCLAYEARPMACRTYISSRVDGCIEEYHNPKDVDIFPDLYEFTIRAGRMINEGICNYLFEYNIPSPEWQIESGLRTAFEDKDAFNKWLSGENIFQKRDYSIEELTYLDNFGTKKTRAENGR